MHLISKKHITIGITLLLICTFIFFIYQKDKSINHDQVLGYFPKSFFDFEYEQKTITEIRNAAMATLSTNTPIRYCGFDTEEKEILNVDRFDCKSFGTGNSLIKRLHHKQQEGVGADIGLNIKTKSVYAIGAYTLDLESIGDVRLESSENPSCLINITKGTKKIFNIESKEYNCSSIASVEYDNKALIVIDEPRNFGNSYSSKQFFLLYDGNNVYDIGTEDNTFRNIYATKVVSSNFEGSFSGQLID
jgi:hypothetical protein